MKAIYISLCALSFGLSPLAQAAAPIPSSAVGGAPIGAAPNGGGVPNVPTNTTGNPATSGTPYGQPIPNNATGGAVVPGDPRASAPLNPGNNTNGTTVNGQFVPRTYGNNPAGTATGTATNTATNTNTGVGTSNVPPAGYR